MIVEYYGDLLDSRCQTLVCTTNCRGAMGAGLALAFKRRYPDTFQAYRQFYDNDWLAIDRLLTAPLGDDSGRQVLFFPTKDHWRDPSRLEWVERNLQCLATDWQKLDISSLAIPPLGAGLGGLDYPTVHAMIHRVFDNHPLYVEFYVPY